jgi:phosphatidate cytidylyltransferase
MPDSTSHPDDSSDAESGSTPPAPVKASRRQTFLQRTGSTLVLWLIIVLAFVFPHRGVFGVLGAVLLGVGLIEYFRIAFSGEIADGRRRGLRLTGIPTLILSLIYLAALFDIERVAVLGEGGLEAFGFAALIVVLVVLRLAHAVEPKQTFREIAIGVFGFAYLTVLFGFVVKILVMPELTLENGKHVGHLYLLFVLAVTKFTDMGAYLVGSLIGKNKMIPHISPGKTWEGIMGGIFFAVLVAAGMKAMMPETFAVMSWTALILVSMAIGVLAVIGDLAESILKRSLVVKDSGHVMPGIGGVLDLIDSILFTAPAFYLYLLVVTG